VKKERRTFACAAGAVVVVLTLSGCGGGQSTLSLSELLERFRADLATIRS
jgi:hypothetical protein